MTAAKNLRAALPAAKPVKAEDFGDNLAARRAWLGTLPNPRVRITVTPTQKRLRSANDNKRLAALDAIDSLLAPHVPDAIADPFEPTDIEAHGDGWRMRPEPSEIARAMLGRVAVRTCSGRTHADRWRYRTWHIGPLVFTMNARYEIGSILRDGKVVAGDIRVPAGAMIERGRTARGVLKPVEVRTYAKPKKDDNTGTFQGIGRRAIMDYIKLPGDWGHREDWSSRMAGEPPEIQRTDDAVANSAILAKYGVDGSVDFAIARENAGLPPTGKCPVGYWWGADWIGIVARLHHGGTGHDRHAKRANEEAIRILTQKWLQEQISANDWKVLSLATSSATAAKAGAYLGMTRQGYVEAANDALSRVSAALMAA